MSQPPISKRNPQIRNKKYYADLNKNSECGNKSRKEENYGLNTEQMFDKIKLFWFFHNNMI